jgi:hypothetical protein
VKLSRFILAAAAIAGLVPLTTEAWNSHGTWSSNNCEIRASSVSFPVGSSYRTALSHVVDRFFNNPSEFWFTQKWGDGSIGFDNGQSEVWFSADSDYDPAVTFWWHNIWGDIVEADVVFYNGEDYTSSMTKTSLWQFGGAYRPFETTAAHEYGHAAGLLHENDEYNIMGEDWTHVHTNGATCRSYVGEDGCDGLVDTYGRYSGGSIHDVSVTLFRYLGTDGEYSTHQKCKMYTSGGTVLGSETYNGQKRYRVNNGQTVKVGFTYETEGETTQTVNIGFYISTNSTISTGDTLFATGWVELGRGNVYTVNSTVTLPNNLTSGQTYYLGVIVDYDNGLTEVDGSNNAAYHIIKVN